MIKFPHYLQSESKDCGPTCLKIVSKHYGKVIPIQQLREYSETTREGSNLHGLVKASEKIGFKTLPVKINFRLLKDAPLPLIIHWDQAHYVVVYRIKKNKIFISDPGYGLISYDVHEFHKRWIGMGFSPGNDEGVALLLDPTSEFYGNNWTKTTDGKLKFILHYFRGFNNYIFQLIVGFLTASFLTLIFPFLTEALVDTGIKNANLNFVYLILFGQLLVFLGKIGFDVVRAWLLLHMSSRININMVSDFFIKLMNLPTGYFDSKMTGDLMQRIGDHHRIENLMTNSSLSTLFSLFNILTFGIILIYYSWRIFLIFIFGSALFLVWILIFQKKRKDLDSKRFVYAGNEQTKVMELINGIQEIKLHNAERHKRWEWENIQIKLFKINIKTLSLEQTQDTGANVINELKNIFITIVSATLVIKGELTLGMMLAIQYIIGQLNSPLLQLMEFIRSLQDAKLSLDRLLEIHEKENEENSQISLVNDFEFGNIEIVNLNFRYPSSPKYVLENISFVIPEKKITAIVGVSGSGKTTLMKILLKFYNIQDSSITVNNENINSIASSYWRANCGVVMQEGFIFNDTITKNIAIGEDKVDQKKLKRAAQLANINNFIDSLPLKFNTLIGNDGLGLSTGQKQRILIARAVYRNPRYIFLDEATSALDANNEKEIMINLNNFFKNKTVLVIAHRLSTVKNADNIIVLDNGKIVENGSHKELILLKGYYYDLVKNQLELGN